MSKILYHKLIKNKKFKKIQKTNKIKYQQVIIKIKKIIFHLWYIFYIKLEVKYIKLNLN